MASRSARIWRSMADLIDHHAKGVLAGVVVAMIVLAAGFPLLKFETSENSLIGASSPTAQSYDYYQAHFGGETLVTMYSGPVARMFTPANQRQFVALEAALKKSGYVSRVITPLTAIELAKAELGVAPKLFAQAVIAHPHAKALEAKQLGIGAAGLIKAGKPIFSNPAYVNFLLHNPDGSIRNPLVPNFPNDHHAVLVVRLGSGLAIAQLGTAVAAVKAIVAAHPIPGYPTLTTGVPTLLTEINDYLHGGLSSLGGLAVLVMIAVLYLVFRARWRLLSLLVVACAAIVTFGLMGYTGIPLNLITISGLPILVGMGVDFAIQVHSRFEEEAMAPEERVGTPVARVLRHLGPLLGAAMVVAAAGFLALQASAVPLVRQFGAMLDVAIIAIFVVVVFVPLAALVLLQRRWDRRHPKPAEGEPAAPRKKHFGTLSLDEHGDPNGWLDSAARKLAVVARSVAIPVTIVALVFAGLGLALETKVPIETSPEKWVPQHGAAETSLVHLRAGIGTSDELDILVRGPNVTTTAVLTWMERFTAAEVKKYPDVFRNAANLPSLVSSLTKVPTDAASFKTLLPVVPPDIKFSFLSPNHQNAGMVYEITPVSLDRLNVVINQMDAAFAGHGPLAPPPGVTATPTGIAAVGVTLLNDVHSTRNVVTYLSLAIVALLLLLLFRSFVKMILLVTPVVIAIGLSSLIVYLLGVSLSPMTALTGPLVAAVGAEFAILMMGRYLEERALGSSPSESVRRGTARIGRAYLASGLTLIGGFAVLAASPFPLLSDFGIIVTVNTIVVLACALILIPPLLVWADEHHMLGHGAAIGAEAMATDEGEAEAPGPVPAPTGALPGTTPPPAPA